jgi:hypothetical protein
MNRDGQEAASAVHERARRLIAARRVEGIHPAEREWLDWHLEACAQCAQEAEAVAAAIDLLRASPVVADASMVRRTRLALRLRAEHVRIDRARAYPLWIVAALSVGWMFLTIPFGWWTFEWLGHATRLPEPVWQGTFLMCWFLPATVVTVIVACRQASEDPRASDWNAQLNRGQV